MYGTIARLHPSPGREDDLASLGNTLMEGAEAAGYRGSYVFRPDQNPYDQPTMFLVALFDDEATYRANATSPEQAARFQRLRDLLADDPDWMDGTFTGA